MKAGPIGVSTRIEWPQIRRVGPAVDKTGRLQPTRHSPGRPTAHRHRHRVHSGAPVAAAHSALSKLIGDDRDASELPPVQDKTAEGSLIQTFWNSARRPARLWEDKAS
jgi:hypothetical protein